MHCDITAKSDKVLYAIVGVSLTSQPLQTCEELAFLTFHALGEADLQDYFSTVFDAKTRQIFDT